MEIVIEGPLDPAAHKFAKPVKRVSTATDIDLYTRTQAYASLVSYILRLNDAVRGHSNSSPVSRSVGVDRCVAMLNQLSRWIDEIPPVQQPTRFGNKAFRAWHARLVAESVRLTEEIFVDTPWARDPASPVEPADAAGEWTAAQEVAAYLRDAFGNATRIDYGTGHETNFVAYMCCLNRLNVLTNSDTAASVTVVFKTYIDVVRKLQRTYYQEPAGSHGVWSLDDYQFLPFLWGASQLIGNQIDIKPNSIHQPRVVEETHEEYLYMAAIRYINQVKRGPFSEHSPMLWDISGVATWEKTNSGLIKMYNAEVLHKHVIMQHFLFGSILAYLPWVPPSNSPFAHQQSRSPTAEQRARSRSRSPIRSPAIGGMSLGSKSPSPSVAPRSPAVPSASSVSSSSSSVSSSNGNFLAVPSQNPQ